MSQDGNDINRGRRQHEPKRVRRRAQERDVGGTAAADYGGPSKCSDVRRDLVADRAPSVLMG